MKGKGLREIGDKTKGKSGMPWRRATGGDQGAKPGGRVKSSKRVGAQKGRLKASLA